MKKKITLIGAGNIGHHLGVALHQAGHQIVQVFSRKVSKAKKLAKLIKADYTNNLSEISSAADVYIIAVHDQAIASVAAQLKVKNKLVVHTSGNTPSTVLKGIFENYGVFYPLQTFSINRAADFTTIPICIDASRKKNRTFLNKLATTIAPNVYEIKDEQRAILHVAAVFVNNFSNQLFNIGEDILKQEKIPFDLLRPLILETALKIQAHPPKEMQTGPAKRKDKTTINRHLEYLDKHPAYQALYQALTSSIQKTHK